MGDATSMRPAAFGPRRAAQAVGCPLLSPLPFSLRTKTPAAPSPPPSPPASHFGTRASACNHPAPPPSLICPPPPMLRAGSGGEEAGEAGTRRPSRREAVRGDQRRGASSADAVVPRAHANATKTRGRDKGITAAQERSQRPGPAPPPSGRLQTAPKKQGMPPQGPRHGRGIAEASDPDANRDCHLGHPVDGAVVSSAGMTPLGCRRCVAPPASRRPSLHGADRGGHQDGA